MFQNCVDWLKSEGEYIVQSGSINNCITHFVRLVHEDVLEKEQLERLISLLRDIYYTLHTTIYTKQMITDYSSNIMENNNTGIVKEVTVNEGEIEKSLPQSSSTQPSEQQIEQRTSNQSNSKSIRSSRRPINSVIKEVS